MMPQLMPQLMKQMLIRKSCGFLKPGRAVVGVEPTPRLSKAPACSVLS